LGNTLILRKILGINFQAQKLEIKKIKNIRLAKTHPSSAIGGKQQVIRNHDGFRIRPVKLRTTAPGPPTHSRHSDRKL